MFDIVTKQTDAVAHVHLPIYNHNLSLKVVFVLQSFPVITAYIRYTVRFSKNEMRILFLCL